MSAIKVSVIIPCYNVEQYISRCLDSVCGQTLKDIEIICVDDCSTDNTLKIIQEYKKKDKRIKLIKSKTKMYAAGCRNTGMDVATGTFVAFMDSDDLYPDNNVLMALYDAAKREKVNICGGGLVYLKDDKIMPAEDLYSFKTNQKIQYKDYQFDYGFTRFIYNRKFLSDNNIVFPNYTVQEDPVFFVNAMTTAKEFFALNINTYCYRITSHDHLCSTEHMRDYFASSSWLLRFCKEHCLHKLYGIIATRSSSEWFGKRAMLCINKDGKVDKVLTNFLSSLDYKIIYAENPDFELSKFYNMLAPHTSKISVIIPVFKVENYLEKCVMSVMSQTYKNLEIILVDDGSPDKCPKICDDLAKKDKRIRVIHKQNGGLSSARNAGLDIATGQYIYFVDSDDYIEPETLQTMLTTMQYYECDIVIAGVQPFYTCDTKPSNFDGMVKYFDTDNCKTYLSSQEIISRPAVAWGKLYKKSIIDKYKLRFDVGLINEDESFNWYYNTKIASGIVILNKFYNYLIRNDSIMGNKQNKGDKIGDILYIVDNVYNHLKSYHLLRKYKNRFRAWAKSIIINTKNMAREFNNEKIFAECNKRYTKYNKRNIIEFLTDDGYYKLPELLFSIKHSQDGCHKIICIFGIKIKYPRKK